MFVQSFIARIGGFRLGRAHAPASARAPRIMAAVPVGKLEPAE